MAEGEGFGHFWCKLTAQLQGGSLQGGIWAWCSGVAFGHGFWACFWALHSGVVFGPGIWAWHLGQGSSNEARCPLSWQCCCHIYFPHPELMLQSFSVHLFTYILNPATITYSIVCDVYKNIKTLMPMAVQPFTSVMVSIVMDFGQTKLVNVSPVRSSGSPPHHQKFVSFVCSWLFPFFSPSN